MRSEARARERRLELCRAAARTQPSRSESLGIHRGDSGDRSSPFLVHRCRPSIHPVFSDRSRRSERMEPGLRTQVALSPDGSLLAHTAVRGGTSRLYLRIVQSLSRGPRDINGYLFCNFRPSSSAISFSAGFPGRVPESSLHPNSPEQPALDTGGKENSANILFFSPLGQ
jgi:hypothetical protein